METCDQRHSTIDPPRMQADQSHPVHDGSLEEAKVHVGVATPHSSAIHTQLEGSGSFDEWKVLVWSHFTDSSSMLPF